MKKYLRHWAIAAFGAAAALALSSCVYDPYYSSAGGSYEGSYNSGYGEGRGYGSSGFSTSVFVGTGNPNWGYDPYRYSYYDYGRRSYYDPYLHGYYPVGYLPPIVYGVPHPHGYRRGYCPPPSYVRYNTVPNYRNREYAYKNSSYGWAKQVRQQPVTKGRIQDQHPARQTSGKRYSSDSRSSSIQRTQSRENSAVRPSSGSSSRQIQGRTSTSQGVRPGIREQQGGRLPAGYNTPVNRPSYSNNRSSQGSQHSARTQGHQNHRGASSDGGGRARQSAPQERGNGKEEGRKEEKRGYRSLGPG